MDMHLLRLNLPLILQMQISLVHRVRDYLFIERARELCFEGFRRFDLIRWNKLAEVLDDFALKFNTAVADGTLDAYVWAAGEYFQEGKHELYPIPSYEIRETKGSLVQNPNY